MATRWTQKTFHKIHQMKTPKPKYLVGDLIEVTDDDWPYLKKGDTGIITYSRCDRVCVKGGVIHLSPAEGGPEYSMEWFYIAHFVDGNPRGTRISNLTPATRV